MTRAESPDTERAYAVSKAGYRPFDCSRQAMRRAALANAAGVRVTAGERQHAAVQAEIIDFASERDRRNPDNQDGPR